MIEQQAKRNRERSDTAEVQPFFLYIAPLAPHKPAAGTVMLQKEFKDLGKEIRLKPTPDLNEADVSDKPKHLQIAQLSDAVMEEMHDEHRKRAITIKSVDEMVGKLFAVLQSNGLADNTYLFFTSDHGYQLGHNRLIAKKAPYHRNTVVPMFVLGPNVKPGKSDHLLAHIDLVPTFLELAGGKASIQLDGKSWMSILPDPDSIAHDDFRSSLLIQNWEEKSQRGSLIPACYASLRLSKKIYTEWSNGTREFYDLENDPYQLENRIDTLTAQQVSEYSKRLHDSKQGSTKPIATIASPELICKTTKIRGFAEDDQAVKEVTVELWNPKREEYWNGNQWQPEKTTVIAELDNPSGLVSNWSVVDLDLSPIKNDGQLSMTVYSKDDQGNVSDARQSTFRVDAIEPETLLKLPARDTTIESPVILFGTCSDDQRMRGIELVLQNLDDKTFWNGRRWTSKKSTFFKRVEQERWHTELELKPGRYAASARAKDKAGNFDATPSLTEFNVK